MAFLTTLAIPELLLTLTSIFLAFFIWQVWVRTSDATSRSPPTRNGWIPWFGVALEYGKDADRYLEKCR